MKVSKILIRGGAVVALVALTGVPVLAQRGKWWQDERFRRELALSTEQSAHLEAIFQKTQPTLRERMQALNRAEEQLDRLIEKGDDASVLEYVGIVESARSELNKTRTVMLLRMRRSLTTDQWAKFTALAEERNDRRGRPDGRRQP
ncbi:MAG: Spy/CpxP family protein refolding chaperone [Vicinamibacterales bacterium]